MKFEEKFKHGQHLIDGTEVQKVRGFGKCANCHENTSWIEINFQAWVCSEECLREMWNEYFVDDAFNMFDVTNREYIKLARTTSMNKHYGQKYGNEDYFHKHIESVVFNLMQTSWGNSPQAIALAYLHDTIEDTDLTLDDITHIFGYKFAEKLDALTFKEKEEYYDEYLTRVKAYDITKAVKICDILANISNLDNLKDKNRKNHLRKKYINALMYLIVGNRSDYWNVEEVGFGIINKM